MTILVTGANGTTGGATLTALAAAGAQVRALVRDPAKLTAPDGVEVVVGDFDDATSLDAALAGVSGAFLVGPSSEGQIALETGFIDAAVRNGLGHIVRLSVIGADDPRADGMRFGAIHRALEQAVVDSGIPYSFLRPNGFMQNCLWQAASIAGQNAFYSALTPAARVSHVDARDIGAVAAAALTQPGHEGKGYTLTGPEALSDDDIAARFTSVLGRSVEHVQLTVEAAQAGFREGGYPEWTIQALTELFAVYESGAAAHVSPDIETVLGRPAIGIDRFIADHAAAFGG